MAKQLTSLITGGAGFIGSHLTDSLLKKGHQVIVVDNFITGNEKNLLDAKSFSTYSFILHNVSEPLIIPESIDFIYHFASPASVVDYQKFPEETALVNSVGTRNMLMLAKEKNARMLFASTSEIYGDPKEHPQKETYWGNVNPNGVRSCYDESKRYGEMMMMLYHRLFHVDTRIIRIFNTYGPRMRPTDGRVISNFINQAINAEPITMYGDGKQTRSFCYVSDLVEGIIQIMHSDSSSGEVYNIGNPEEYTMNDVAMKIKELSGSQSEIKFEPLPQDDPEKRRPDITKISTQIGWKPTISLEAGLKQTMNYYQALKNA